MYCVLQITAQTALRSSLGHGRCGDLVAGRCACRCAWRLCCQQRLPQARRAADRRLRGRLRGELLETLEDGEQPRLALGRAAARGLHPLADLRLKAEAERAPLLLDLELGLLALLQLLAEEVLARVARVQAAPDGQRA